MKYWPALVLFFCLLFLFGPGCGGGGTGSTTATTNSTTGTIVRYAVEATKNGSLIDPTNIEVGETVQFDIAGYTATNQRIVQSSSNWLLTGAGSSEGTLTPSGQFTATAAGGVFSVSGSAGGNVYATAAQVRPATNAFVTGNVIDGYGDAVPGLTLDFYDSGGTLVDTSITQGDGTFRASVPTTAATFEVDRNSIPTNYYKEYEYLVLHGTTTVTVGQNSSTQIVGSTANMAVGYSLHFAHEGVDDVIDSVTNSTTVVLANTVNSSTGETVTISSDNWFLPQGVCRAPLPALTSGQTSPLNSSVLVPPKTFNGANLAPPPPPSPCT